MLKELMATIGIGSAKVSLEVASHEVEIGGILHGTIQIKGGSVEQLVNKTYINLVLTSAYGSGSNIRDLKRTILSIPVAGKMTLSPEQEVSIPVQFKIPQNLPISKGRTKYYLLAGLDINQAINPKDSVSVTILPNNYMNMLFEAFSILGFKEKPGFGDYAGMYQEFEYIPTEFMAQELDGIEMFPFTNAQEIMIALHIIKRTWGCFGSGEMDLAERREQFRLPYDEMTSNSQLADKLREIIQLEYRACS